MDASKDTFQEKPIRPALITVMCILTIVGSSIGIVLDMISFFSLQVGNVDIPYPIWLPGLGIAFGAGKIVAAIFMLNMKKLGFYIYAPLEAGVACLSMVSGKIQMEYMDVSFVNQTLPFDPSIISMVTTGMWVILSIAFIILYGSQLSKME